MPVIIDGIKYFTATDILKDLAVSRQTLWRWRAEGKIPSGRRDRRKRVLFNQDEFDAIRAHANLLEPIDTRDKDQLKLFNGANNKKKR